MDKSFDLCHSTIFFFLSFVLQPHLNSLSFSLARRKIPFLHNPLSIEIDAMHASSKTAASSSARGGVVASSKSAVSTTPRRAFTKASALPSSKPEAEAQVRPFDFDPWVVN